MKTLYERCWGPHITYLFIQRTTLTIADERTGIRANSNVLGGGILGKLASLLSLMKELFAGRGLFTGN